MEIISSNNLPYNISHEESEWIYNGMDCESTLAAWNGMQELASANTKISYDFVSGMRAPALEMQLRGIKVDMEVRERFLVKYRKDEVYLQDNLNAMAHAVWDKPLNMGSPTQMKAFFYDTMQMTPIYKYSKGKRSLSTDRTALEKIAQNFFAMPIANTAMALRDVTKKLQFLHTGVSSDGRLRTSFNVVGTETGRWSSSSDPFNEGGNQQNIEDELRQMLIADLGMKLGYFDLEQAESRVVAYVSGDVNYIKAFESGDLHTTVAIMCWPNLPWTGVMKDDRKIADQIYYRHFTYRDIAKRLGHATNYNGAARTLAGILKIPEQIVIQFQSSYFAAFPGIRRWHQTVATQLQTKGYLITALGRKRNFLGRRYDDATLREAIAYEPQSTVGELLNLFLYRIWKHREEHQCLAQIHDAVLGQYPMQSEATLIPAILKLAEIPVKYPIGTMIIPAEAQVGWNWAKATEQNPHGLRKYKGNDDRLPPVYKGILDWQIHSV